MGLPTAPSRWSPKTPDGGTRECARGVECVRRAQCWAISYPGRAPDEVREGLPQSFGVEQAVLRLGRHVGVDGVTDQPALQCKPCALQHARRALVVDMASAPDAVNVPI